MGHQSLGCGKGSLWTRTSPLGLCEARIAVDEQGLGKTKESQIHRQEAETVLKAVLGDSHPLISLIDPVETQRYNVLFPIGLI